MSTNWDLCFICQEKKKCELCSSSDGWESLASMLPKFFIYNALIFYCSPLECNINSNDLYELFRDNNALYHHSCQIKYSNTKLTRLALKAEKLAKSVDVSSEDSLSSPPCKRRASTRNDTLNNEFNKVLICCFCRQVDESDNLVAACTFHAKKESTDKKHVSDLTKTWIEMASLLHND